MERSEETKCSKTSLDSYPNEEGEEENESNEVMELKDGGSSSNSTVEESDKKPSVRPYVRSKMPRLRWTNDLHLRFVQAVERLGGQDKATPKLVLQLMNVKGLHIAHVKSHLQMYRSKKFDDPNQGLEIDECLNPTMIYLDCTYLSSFPLCDSCNVFYITVPDPTIEGGDPNIYNLSQLQMLQCYNRTCDSTFRYGDASLYHHDWMHNALKEHRSIEKTKPRFYNMAADRILALNHVGQTSRNLHNNHMPPNAQVPCRIAEVHDSFRSRISEKKEMLQGLYTKLPNNTLNLNPLNVQEHQPIVIDLESTSLGKDRGTKRKASNLDLNLNLSLDVHSGHTESPKDLEEDNGEGEGNLSLSLCSPSLSRTRNKLIREDDHCNDQKPKRASTLDLTI
ncbi:putative transcription factor MYB-HB-like family [Helianthus debilis subsp. tardiflorus]